MQANLKQKLNWTSLTSSRGAKEGELGVATPPPDF